MSVYNYSLLLCTTILVLWTSGASAQTLTTPETMGTGGGGTAFVTGYESLFVNPANLYIREKEYRTQLSAVNFSTYLSSPVHYNEIHKGYKSWYMDQTAGFRPNHKIPTAVAADFLERNFKNNSLLSEHQSSGELHLFGIQWYQGERAFALALRTRYSGRTTTGRSFYDATPVEKDGLFRLNRSLTYQFQSLHELSFGYAETFTYIDGLIPKMSRLIIGIAPKLVAGGSYIDMDYRNTSQSSTLSGKYQNSVRFQQQTAGGFTENSTSWPLAAGMPTPEWQTPGRGKLFNPSGIGAGIDVGLTYIITLGDDLSAIRETNTVTRKSLRFSLAVTDIGMIRYSKQPRYISTRQNHRTFTPDYAVSPTIYTGRPGEHFYFLSENEENPLENVSETNSENFTVLLPAAIHAGTLFQMNWLKLKGDVSLGLTNNAFHTKRLIGHIGTEIRILPHLPLRAGTRLATDLPGYYSFGGGFETQRFDLNIAFMLRSKSSGFTSELSGASLAALTVYIL